MAAHSDGASGCDAIDRALAFSSALCIASRGSAVNKAARARAACIDRTFPSTSSAFRVAPPPSSATAIALAPEVSPSICDDDADSLRSSRNGSGPGPPPSSSAPASAVACSASKRETSAAASSASADAAADTRGEALAMEGTTEAAYGPRWRSRTDRGTRSGGSVGVQGTSRLPSAGHGVPAGSEGTP